jgi:hypothetical protein
VCDPPNGTITVFLPTGEMKRTIRVQVMPLRILTFGHDEFLLMVLSGPYLFMVFDSSGAVVNAFGEFLKDQIVQKAGLDGWICRNGSNGFFYAPLYASYLFAFLYSGEMVYSKQMFEGIDWPPMISTPAGAYVDPTAQLVTLSVNTAMDTVHLLNRSASGHENVSVIDAYKRTSGSYLYSIRLPERCKEAVVTGTRVYSLRDTTIAVWMR